MLSLKINDFKKKFKSLDSECDFKTCTIILLDEHQTPLTVKLDTETLGSTIFDEVENTIGKLPEKDYFGLRFIDSEKQKYWLKLDKVALRQLKKAKTNVLYFSVKHYPSEPLTDLFHELSRYQLYLQLRKDLYSELVIVHDDILSKLIAMAIQAEIGDSSDSNTENILSSINSLKIYKNVTVELLKKIGEVLETFKGFEPVEMESQFIQTISQLESYGIEPNNVSVKNQKWGNFYLAINHQGICAFLRDKRFSMHYWENITKMSFVKKNFYFEVNIDNKRLKLEFKFITEKAAAAFWTWAMDRQSFMTLSNSTEARRTIFSNKIFLRRKLKHKFSGRSKREVTESCQSLANTTQPPIIRTRNTIEISRSNSVKALLRDSVVLDSENTSSYATLPRSTDSNKQISVISIDFQHGVDDAKVAADSNINDNFVIDSNEFINPTYVENQLADIDECPIIEMVESTNVLSDESTYPTRLSLNDEDRDTDLVEELEEAANEIRERITGTALEIKSKDQQMSKTHSNELLADCTSMETDFRYRTTDGIFFLKFVVITSLLLLFVMVTSLFAYYYYRSATIAELKKEKFSSDVNNNIDLEAIKRFVLRNDAP